MSITSKINIKKIFANLFLLLFFSLFFFSLAFSFSFAQVCTPECSTGQECIYDPVNIGQTTCQNIVQDSRSISFSSPTSATSFADVVCNVTDFLSSTLVPPIAVLMAMIVGFLYLISQGEPDRLKLANRILVFTFIGVAVVILSPALVALFADITGQTVSTSACSGAGVTTDTIVNSILNLVDWMSWFVALTAVVSGLYSAFLFLTSSGDSEKTQKAYKVFVFAVIGVAIAVLAFGIVSIVEMFL